MSKKCSSSLTSGTYQKASHSLFVPLHSLPVFGEENSLRRGPCTEADSAWRSLWYGTGRLLWASHPEARTGPLHPFSISWYSPGGTSVFFLILAVCFSGLWNLLEITEL